MRGGGGGGGCSGFGTEDRKPFDNGVSTIVQLVLAHTDTGQKAYLTFAQNTVSPWLIVTLIINNASFVFLTL